MKAVCNQWWMYILGCHLPCSGSHYRFRFAVVLRLRPVLTLASRVLPSTPPLSHRVERHFFDGQLGGFSVSGIHLCPHTSHTATRIVLQPIQTLYRILPYGHNAVDIRVKHFWELVCLRDCCIVCRIGRKRSGFPVAKHRVSGTRSRSTGFED